MTTTNWRLNAPNRISWFQKSRLLILVLSISVLIISQLTLCQNTQELCPNGPVSSILCRAGQAVIGSATNFASKVLGRPKHWGVPENEPLDLHSDFHRGAPKHRPHLPSVANIDDQYFSNHRNNHQHDSHRKPRPPPKREHHRTCITADNTEGVCKPLHTCYHRHGPSINYLFDNNQCPRGFSLVCCPLRRRDDDDKHSNFNAVRLSTQNNKKPSKPTIGIETLRSIVSQVFHDSKEDIENSNNIERSIVSEGLALKKDSPSDLHQRFIQLRNSELISKLARDGADFLEVASRVAKQSLEKEEPSCEKIVEKGPDGTLITKDGCNLDGAGSDQAPTFKRRASISEIDFSNTDLATRCPGDPVCPIDAIRIPYRSHDGSCNNLAHTAWGRSNTPYTRILPPDYEDGVNEIRKTGVTGKRLPNPRSVSLATVVWSERQDNKASLMLMQWGQFIDHDITLAATTPMLTPQGTNIDCCNRRLLMDPRFKHPACISILLPDLDPFYSKFQVGCMNLVRSAPSPPIGCRLRAREQLNQLTHFLDGSMIYGNDGPQALGLRQFHGGLLKSSRINGAEFLPFDSRLGEGCILPSAGIRRGMRCFVAGDNRVNELTGLVTTHAIFLREHNRVARILSSLNRDWPDELIYQEARRFVIAEIQHITFNEFLPILLGTVVMKDFNLELSRSQNGYSFDYDPETDPSIINEFAGAAYRLHSLVKGAFNFQTEDGKLIQKFRLREIFNNPASLYREGNYDGCIHSMVNDQSQSVDNHFTEELTNHLFQDTNSSFGMDLVTVNIQRGRDHGLPGYNFFRQACGLVKIKSFEQLDSVMMDGAGRIFSQLYSHVDDIDLFIGGTYEKRLRDAMVGPVFACIIGEQFRRLKVGDRYWYENGDQAGAFTPGQLAEVKKTSMARIICDNSDEIERVQPLAFLRPSEWNPKVPCEQLPWVDLRFWRHDRRRDVPSFGPSSFRRFDGIEEESDEPNVSR